MITILGPTASGKTSLAVELASTLGAEIISADSRQVYRRMDIGTGKDLEEYQFNDRKIPYHLIDIRDAGYEYNVYEYQKDFYETYGNITSRNKEVILCGGSGMYIEAVLKGYQLLKVPNDDNLRAKLEESSHEDLIRLLDTKKVLHNTTDTSTKKRTIRAIEIAVYCEENKIEEIKYPAIKNQLFGIHFERDELKRRITFRLKERLENGMLEEVKSLLDSGITPEKLKYYGLEYKFLALHLTNELNHNDMFQKLNAAIHQFSKRQMTWFRKMERSGFEINWIDGHLSNPEKTKRILNLQKK